MKEKEEDEERNDNICLQAHNQSKSNSKTEATLSTVVCGSSGSGPITHHYKINRLARNKRLSNSIGKYRYV